MRVQINRTPGQGVTFTIDSGISDGGYQWGLPARVYRKAARDVIDYLLAENRALRHNKLVVQWRQPPVTMLVKGTVLKWLAPKGED